MAESPRHDAHRDSEPSRFCSVDLRVAGRRLHIQRPDSRAEVEAARLHSFAAGRALANGAAYATAEAGPARLAADDATAVFRAAVRILTEFGALEGMDGSPTLEVDVEMDPDGVTAVVRPHGELDLLTSPRLENICAQQLAGETPARGLQVDLSAVSFLDSSGLAVLVEVRRDCIDRDTAFALTGLTAKTRRLLQITGLDTVLDIV